MTSKTWFITGTSRGFGREWTEAALERGDRVVATARNVQTLDDVSAKYGDAVLALELDVTDRSAVFETVANSRTNVHGLGRIVNRTFCPQFDP